jgi:uncharacterized protein with beta-barrel porin domain
MSAEVSAGFSITGGGSLVKRGAGAFAFNASADSAVLTVSQGTLGGGGTLGGLTFAGGTYAPVLDAGSVTAEHLTVSGSATGLATAAVAPVWAGGSGLSAGQSASYLILDTTGGISGGPFGSAVELVKATYTQTILGGSQLYLNVVANSLALSNRYGMYLTPNGNRVAPVLDNAERLGLLTEIVGMNGIGGLNANDTAGIARAVNQLHHEGAAAVHLAGGQGVRRFNLQTPSIFALTRDIDVGAVGSPSAMASVNGYPGANRLTVFASPFGSWADQKGRGGYSGYDLDAYGLSLGVMKSLENLHYGLAAGYTRQRQDMKDYFNRIDSDVLHLSLFAGMKFERLFVDASVGHSHAWNDSERCATFPLPAHSNRGKFGQDFFSGRLALGYVFELPNRFTLTPGFGVDLVHSRAKGFTEGRISLLLRSPIVIKGPFPDKVV